MHKLNHYTSILCYIGSEERFNRDMALQNIRHGKGQRIGTGRFEKFTVRRVLRHRRRRARNVLRCRLVHCGFSRACVGWSSAWMRLDFLANHRVHRRQSTHVIAKSSIGMHRLCDVLS